MSMNLVDEIKIQADSVFVEYGFIPTVINNESVYKRKSTYLKFTFISGFNSFVIEYAGSLKEAEKNMYEDNNLYPIYLGDKQLINLLRDDIQEYYLDD